MLFGSDGAFVQSLYVNLLNRRGADAEIAGWLVALANVGRSGVAAGFVQSVECREIVVRRHYAQILNRPGVVPDAEVDGWVNSGLDFLSIAIAMAGSPEFQANG